LTGDTTARAAFMASAPGDLAFELVVGTDSSMSRARAIRVNVVIADSMFVEDSGRVVIEAEHFATTTERGGQKWTVGRDLAGFSGDGYAAVGPARGTTVEPGQFRARAPELRYTVWIQHPGTYVAYVRGSVPDSARGSVHIGLDNEEARLADRVGRLPVGRWGWARDAFEWDEQFQMTDTTLAVLNIVEPGPHVLNVRRNGQTALRSREWCRSRGKSAASGAPLGAVSTARGCLPFGRTAARRETSRR
jgi:hypothetical protein